MFVCFEGIDGAGKSTQARTLVQKLKSLNVAAELVADPGTTQIGTAIRQILLHNDAPISTAAQMLLFSAARAELAEYIRGRLADNVTVVCDRWLLSTLVYQSALNGVDTDFILSVFRQTSNLTPDLCVLLDLPPEQSATRTGPGRDRYERVTDEVRRQTRAAYLKFSGCDYPPDPAAPLCARQLCVVNAELPAEAIHDLVFCEYERLNCASCDRACLS
jgi:dTMP kinase